MPVIPPSTTRVAPLLNRPSGPATKETMAAISSGVPMRPSSCLAAIASRAATGSGAFARILPIKMRLQSSSLVSSTVAATPMPATFTSTSGAPMVTAISRLTEPTATSG